MGFGLIRRDSNLPKITRSQAKSLAGFDLADEDMESNDGAVNNQMA